MSANLIDTHCHLDSESFRADLDDVLHRARTAGVVRMLTIGINAASSRAVVLLANRYDCLSAIVGIHPNHTHEVQPGTREQNQQPGAHPPGRAHRVGGKVEGCQGHTRLRQR